MTETLAASLKTMDDEAVSIGTTTVAAVADIRLLVTNRAGDVVIAAIVLASIWLGHSL
jgi:hypothetical protein